MRQAVVKVGLWLRPKNPIAHVKMKQKQVVDIHPGKGMTLAQSNEHLRVAAKGAYKSRLSNNFDPTREHLNFEVKPGGVICPLDKGNSIPKRIRKNIKERGIVDPNSVLETPFYRTVANVILGGSREQMHRLAFGTQVVDLEKGADNSQIVRLPEIEAWAKDMYKFMSERYGEKNIAAFIVHLDESNPHIHCTLLPITENNKFSFRKVMVGENNSKFDFRQRTLELHNEISQINQRYGLERGDPKTETGAKHRSMEQYHHDLRKQLQQENEELSKTIEGNESTIKDQRKTIHSLDRDIKHATARFKALGTMIANLESHKRKLMEDIEQLEKDRASGKLSEQEVQAKLQKIQKELEEVDAKIADKTQKLSIAEQQLAQLQVRTQTAERKYEDVQRKLQKDVPQLNKVTLQEMQAMGYVMIATDTKHRTAKYEEFLQTLPFEQRQAARDACGILLDGSIVECIAEKAAHVASIATALYLGYLDAATKISQGNGGGGGPGTGWGKRDDEDDLAFRQRCFFMAVHMMRPSQKIQRKR